MPEFPCTGPITVVAKLAAGSLQIVGEERDTALVVVEACDPQDQPAADDVRVELRGDTLHVEAPSNGRGWGLRRAPRLWVKITLPVDSSVKAVVSTAELACQGRLGNADLRLASGSCTAQEFTGRVTIGAASGAVQVGRVSGPLKVHGASGDITVEQAGRDADLQTASGAITIERAEGVVRAKTASGSVRLGEIGRGEVHVHTVSGNVTIGVVAGTGVWMDLTTISGRTSSELQVGGAPAEPAQDLTLRVATISGNIDLHRVTQPATA
jgi:hypothetical protein